MLQWLIMKVLGLAVQIFNSHLGLAVVTVSNLSFIPGIDNSLSSYMNQRSVDGKIWRRRFVLTNRTLICYDTHLFSDQKVYCLALYFTFSHHDEAIGAISLAGYTLSLPTEVHQSFQSGS